MGGGGSCAFMGVGVGGGGVGVVGGVVRVVLVVVVGVGATPRQICDWSICS